MPVRRDIRLNVGQQAPRRGPCQDCVMSGVDQLAERRDLLYRVPFHVTTVRNNILRDTFVFMFDAAGVTTDQSHRIETARHSTCR